MTDDVYSQPVPDDVYPHPLPYSDTAPVPDQAFTTPDDDTEMITCPECGTAARATLNRREAADFCRTCDYPLFWTPSKVRRGGESTDESLRRLPGTVGRATLASLPCPHCAEPNSLSAQICVRCGQPMHPVAQAPAPAPPPPVPVYQPVYVPEPEPHTPWWVWLLLGLVFATIITLVILVATDVIN